MEHDEMVKSIFNSGKNKAGKKLKSTWQLRRLRKWWKEWKDEFVNFLLNSQNDPGNRLDPGSYKESPEVEKTDVVQPVNVFEEEEESAENDCELRRRVKGKHVKEFRHTSSPTTTKSPREAC
ncbi:hypothetical protein Tco_0925147 [Tanacetum coccineum]|uniref:DUF5641 domain-containing protein n=1 Tax=Tanacetum coccineum TaxID=301880 RepID=A0ABQ5D819_9ASTR